MNKTPRCQIKASSKYYHEHKADILESRNEYYREYSKNRYDQIKNDEEARLKRNEYYRNYRQKKKTTTINKMFIAPELEILSRLL